MQIHISRGDNIRGPFTREQIQYWLEKGTLLPDDLAYHDGLNDWIPLSRLMDSLVVPVAPEPTLAPAQSKPVVKGPVRSQNMPWSQSKLGRIHNRCRQITGGFGCVFWLFIAFYIPASIFIIGAICSKFHINVARARGFWWTYFGDLAFIVFFIWIIALVWVWWVEKQEKNKLPQRLKAQCYCGSGKETEACCYVGPPEYARFGRPGHWGYGSRGSWIGGCLIFSTIICGVVYVDTQSAAGAFLVYLAPLIVVGLLGFANNDGVSVDVILIFLGVSGITNEVFFKGQVGGVIVLYIAFIMMSVGSITKKKRFAVLGLNPDGSPKKHGIRTDTNGS